VTDLAHDLCWQLRAARLPLPEREVVFARPRRWRFDLCWPKTMLACEIEGGIWQSGRHTRGQGFENDCEKYGEALLLGWRVLRVTTSMVRDGRALRLIERALTVRGA
jgi:hypothetical protein